MKKLALVLAGICLAAGLAFAQESGNVVLKGDIIDNMCAGSQRPADLAGFVKTHTKQCALMPQCEASGYSIFSDDKLFRFDKESSVRIADFLKKPDSKLQVTVVAKETADGLSLVSVENQK